MNTKRLWPIVTVTSVFVLSVLLSACRPAAGRAPGPTAAPTSTAEIVATAQASPTSMSTVMPEPTATPTPEEPASTPWPMVDVIEVEPTNTPSPGDARTEVGDLPLGQKEHYVNLTFGYHLRHPAEWYTGFGNRPLLVSFSNLDPGTHNRASMRAEGCLVEIKALTNVFGLTLQEMRPQLTLPFDKVEEFDLGGKPALRVWPEDAGKPFQSEWVYVEHGDRLFLLTFEYGEGTEETCRHGWEKVLNFWEWFEPEFAVYRNPTYGYAISYPNYWHRFNPHERGISIASKDPTGMADVVEFIAQEEMLVTTEVFDNPERLPLKEWLADQYFKFDLTNDIPLEGIIGVRVLREGPTPEIREMSGYYQGAQGRIYVVTCLYPAEKRLIFRSIANAILFSFSF
jgi:hypothetical protein